MELDFVPESGMGLACQIQDIANLLEGTVRHAFEGQLDSSFSAVPGLDQLGASHGQVLCGGVGSAADVLACYKQHVNWISKALAASIEALASQEDCNSRAMDIADQGGDIGTECVSFPQRPPMEFHPFTFAAPAAAGVVTSLDQLISAFAGTKLDVIRQACQAWSMMSGEILDVVTRLAGIADELLTCNTGDIFQRAVEIITKVVEVGKDFAANAATMAATLNHVDAVTTWGQQQAVTAKAGIDAIPDPVAQKAAEQEFLAGFMGGEFPAALQGGVPPIGGLMDSAQSTASQWNPAGGQPIEAGFGSVAGSGQPLNIGPALRVGTAAPTPYGQPTIGSTLGAVGQVVDGIHRLFGGIGTQQAGVGPDLLHPPTPPHTLGFAGTPAPTPGYSPSPFGAAPMPLVGPQQPISRSGMNGIDSAPMYGKHAAPPGPINGATTPSGGAAAPMPMSGAMGTPLMGAWNKRGHSAPIGGLTGNSPAGPGPSFGSSPVPTASTSSNTVATGTRGGYMGGMPMAGGAPHHAAQQGKQKRSRNKLERNKNVNDLIGELKPVLDGPIGAWVRQPG
ncbi:hypothetical protein [Corynebacterium sp.]|uniref:hypothetical protein n=1 Tax=Corynebacterium sp. TaxID=1720 RepID=UPI0026DB7DCA|nr:hypothetical protein [Corynebacterium sp.]MDO5076064.1 hypothetical protein [Corynebacterium sp.]